MARHIEFVHPVSGKKISLTAPVPEDNLWKALEADALGSAPAEIKEDEVKDVRKED